MSIIVIGRNTLDDYITLEKVSDFLISRCQHDLAIKLLTDANDYDISTMPEKGDAMDAIGPQTELVVALHIYGIDQMPGRPSPFFNQPYTYCRNNQSLLKKCMAHGIPLVAWGDQPWLGVERKTMIHKNNLWIYEPKY